MTTLISSNSFVSYPEGWPKPLADDAFLGLAGAVVDEIAPTTEADPVALLASFLTAFGNAVGPRPYAAVGATKHHPREFVVMVGATARARKGDSWNAVRVLFDAIDPTWTRERIAGGLSTGEGLINAVRDPQGEDPGVSDKRLLVVEPEFARVLKVQERQGNSLSPVIRAAWDQGSLAVMTRANPIRATDAHVSIIAHITEAEIKRDLTDVSSANGFANRFIWFCIRRTKLLPDPSPFIPAPALVLNLSDTLRDASRISLMVRSNEAREHWIDTYARLSSDEDDGLASTLLARAEAHVLRLSMLYALLDTSTVIHLNHQLAALALWQYAEDSANYLFGETLGDPCADAIVRALRVADVMSRTEISAIFGRNESAARISAALQSLQAKGIAQVGFEETSGRPREMWSLIE